MAKSVGESHCETYIKGTKSFHICAGQGGISMVEKISLSFVFCRKQSQLAAFSSPSFLGDAFHSSNIILEISLSKVFLTFHLSIILNFL